MTETETEGFGEVYATLKQKFLVRSISQRERLAYICARSRDGAMTRDELTEAYMLCHGLHGSAGTFGFPTVGVVAGDAERSLKLLQMAAPDAPDTPMLRQRATSLVDRLVTSLQVLDK